MAHKWKTTQATQSQAVAGAGGAAPAHSLLANKFTAASTNNAAAKEEESDAEMASSNEAD